MGGLRKTLSAFRANDQGETAEPGTPCFSVSIGHSVPKATAGRLADDSSTDAGQRRRYNPAMPRYFLGLDVGGAKTPALVADEIGRALGFGVGGPGNPQGVGYEGLTRAVVAATRAALAAASLSQDQIVGAGFGIAGFDWPSQRGATLRALDPLGLHAPLKIVNIVPISIPCTLNGLSLTRV